MSSWYNNVHSPRQKDGVLELEGMPQLGGMWYCLLICISTEMTFVYLLSGITLLEETLIQKGEEDERPSKRARGATGSKAAISGDTKVWIELAKYVLIRNGYLISSKYGIGCQKQFLRLCHEMKPQMSKSQNFSINNNAP